LPTLTSSTKRCKKNQQPSKEFNFTSSTNSRVQQRAATTINKIKVLNKHGKFKFHKGLQQKSTTIKTPP